MPPRLQRNPLVPSPLSHPVSPFSPLSPLLPTLRNVFNQSHTPAPISSPPTSNVAPTPDSPLPWLWACHSCYTSYPLGATRRCLDDGHTFCAGVSSVKRRGRNGVRKERRRRSRACGSEFDYTGWKAWSRWRKTRDSSRDGASGEPTSLNREMEVDTAMHRDDQVLPRHCHREGAEECSNSQTRPSDKETEGKKKKDYWEACTYPSHCRWGKAVGIHTPSSSTATFSFNSFPNTPDTQMSDMPTLDECFESSPPPATGEECIDPQLLSPSSKLVLLPSSSERDSEGRTENPGPMALDTPRNASSSSSSTVVHDSAVEKGASASLRQLSLSPPLSSLYPAWGNDGKDKRKEKGKEKRSRYLRRCARVTGIRVRTALF